jgi:uncharacterized protein (UPF0332 family)
MNAAAAVARARRYLKTAALALQEEDNESCVSRAYYAMFYMTRALVRQHNIDARTHSGIINQFSLHFVKTGVLPIDRAEALSRAFNLRQLAEYADDFVIPHDEAEATLRDAETFVTDLENMLR